MKDFARTFYSSKAWKDTRTAYAKSKGGLCELCLANGIYKAGEIVHHKCHITPENVNDPQITLNWSNLQLVCREHHAEAHDKRQRRYRIDETGKVVCL